VLDRHDVHSERREAHVCPSRPSGRIGHLSATLNSLCVCVCAVNLSAGGRGRASCLRG
jgi:hypothetical protein